MRRVTTPGEVARWQADLAPLEADRRDAVVQMLCEVVADCPICDEPVRRCDPRRLVGDEERLAHLRCASDAAPGRGRDGGRKVIGRG